MVDQARSTTVRLGAVPEQFDAARLDAFVRHCLPHLSRRVVDQAIGAKLILLDGRVGKKGDRLAAGMRVDFAGPPDWLAERPLPATTVELAVIYEDDSILALNKPAGLPTHGFSARDRGTLANSIAARWPELLHIGTKRWEPGLLHRLDVETSGVILFAKTQAAFDELRGQFRRHEISKSYLALVLGDTDGTGVIDWPLVHDRSDRRKMRIADGVEVNDRKRHAWRALTHYRKMGAAQGVSLLEVTMTTGVTHQIRAHLAARGFPIVGDELYGGAGRPSFGLSRHFLHAKGLGFRHPTDARRIDLAAELPSELTQLLGRIGLNV
jgi:23S rRNA pseudouridine1911/1915/1917 synthase